MTPCFFNSGAAFLWGGSSTETVLKVSFGTAPMEIGSIEFTYFFCEKKTPKDSFLKKKLGHLQISPSIQKMKLALLFKFEIMRKKHLQERVGRRKNEF